MYTSEDTAFAAAMAIVIGVTLLAMLVGYAISAFFTMKLFQKAGVQGAWRAWVPLYNTMVFAKLGDVNPIAVVVLWGGTLLGAWIPLLGPLIATIGSLGATALMLMAALRIQQKLGKDTVWIALFLLVGVVWMAILAFDDSRWNPRIGPAPWAQYTFLADTTTWEGIPVQDLGPAPQAPWPGAATPPPGYAPGPDQGPPSAPPVPPTPPAPPTSPASPGSPQA